MSLSPSRTVPVHSHSLGELMAALTSLAQYSAQLLAGPQEAQPSRRAIWPPFSCLLHLSCHSPALHQCGFISSLFRDLSSSRLGSIVIHRSLFSFYPSTSVVHLPVLLFSHPSTSSPLFPLCSNEGVGSSVINDGLSRVWVCVCVCVARVRFAFVTCRQAHALINVSAYFDVCIWSR